MILQFEDLKNIRIEFNNHKIVFFDGVFDLFHIGHLSVLESVSKMGDIVMIGVMSDEWVKEKKGEMRPIMNQNERAAIIDALRFVTYTLILANCTQRIKTSEVLMELKPDIFFTHDEVWKNKFQELNISETQLVLAKREIPAIVSNVTPISTSALIEKIKRNNCD